MDKAQLKELLGELIKEALEERLEVLQDRKEKQDEKETKFRRRKKKENGTDNIPKVRKGKRHVPAKENFLEGMQLTESEKRELESASQDDKKNNVHNRTQNRLNKRRPSGKIEVRCRVCGRKESVSPLFIYKDDDGYRYKCNKCSCSPG